MLRVSGLPEEMIMHDRLAIILEQGGAGVNIFFFISGFVLSLPFLKALQTSGVVSLKHYYQRRLIRIEPPYIISLLILFIPAVYIVHANFEDAFKHLAASIFYVHNIVYGSQSTINPVAWTLEIEMQFYLLLPLFAFLFFRKNVYVRRILLIAALFGLSQLYASNVSWFEANHLSKSFIAYAANFFTGIIIADVFITHKNFFSGSKHFLWDVAGIVALVCIFHYSGYQAWDIRLLVFIFYSVMFIAMFKGKLLPALLSNKWIVTIGGMCYSIYLVHYAVIYAAVFGLRHLLTGNYYGDVVLHSVVLVPVVLVCSGGFFVGCEKRFLTHKSNKLFDSNFVRGV